MEYWLMVVAKKLIILFFRPIIPIFQYSMIPVAERSWLS